MSKPSKRPSGVSYGHLVVVGVVVVLVAGLGVVVATGDHGDGQGSASTTTPGRRVIERRGSRPVEGDPLEIVERDEAYRVTYRVVSSDGREVSEEVTVRRPFLSETVVRRDGEVIGRSRSAFGLLLEGVDDARAAAIGPALAGGDLRPSAGLRAAVAAGLLERRELREVAGRRCQVYRAATSVTAGTLGRAIGNEHSDVCFDGGGLLLEEWWVRDGRPLRHRIATQVEVRVPAAFGAGWAEVQPAVGSFEPLDPDTAPTTPFYGVAAVPHGFTRTGRYRTVVGVGASPAGEAPEGTITDVYQRGVDLLVVEQGPLLLGGVAYQRDDANGTIDVGGVGLGEIVIGLRANDVRIAVADGRLLRVFGTLPPDALVAIAQSLRLAP